MSEELPPTNAYTWDKLDSLSFQDDNELHLLVTDCIHRQDRLSQLEADFIQSCNERLENNQGLYPKQVEKLNQIWNKATENG